MPVKESSDVFYLMKFGQKNCASSYIALNENNNHSQNVLIVYVQDIDRGSRYKLQSCLPLVDIVGSERMDKYEVTRDRFKQAHPQVPFISWKCYCNMGTKEFACAISKYKIDSIASRFFAG
jgi:hypothetical protein